MIKHPWWNHSAEILNEIKISKEELERVSFNDAVSEQDYSYKLKTKRFPYSCTDEEGLLLYFTILENEFRSGFEIATAFGYSTNYIGLAMKKNHGVCTTLDCYIEEFKENYLYEDSELQIDILRVKDLISTGKYPEGLNFAMRQRKKLGLESVVEFKVGLSPSDVAEMIGHREIDFAFIDGGHFGDQPTKDLLAIAPYLSRKCAVLFHDNNNNPSVSNAVQKAESLLQSKSFRTLTRYNLTLVGRNLSESFLKLFLSFPNRQRVSFSDICEYVTYDFKKKLSYASRTTSFF